MLHLQTNIFLLLKTFVRSPRLSYYLRLDPHMCSDLRQRDTMSRRRGNKTIAAIMGHRISNIRMANASDENTKEEKKKLTLEKRTEMDDKRGFLDGLNFFSYGALTNNVRKSLVGAQCLTITMAKKKSFPQKACVAIIFGKAVDKSEIYFRPWSGRVRLNFIITAVR